MKVIAIFFKTGRTGDGGDFALNKLYLHKAIFLISN